MSSSKVIDEKYAIKREIKRGGFGIIYEGTDLLFGKPVAIKAVDPSLLNEAKYIDMFQAEALSIARLNHHNIVHIYDIKRDDDGQFYIVMEYIDGLDLYQLIRACRKRGIPIPLHLGVYIVAEVCSGLDYAHNRRDNKSNKSLNIVHQDISPSNIMITRNGEVKIIDFGMANFRRSQAKNKREISIQGKLNYLAPEQLNGTVVLDRRTDIFALGLVLYEVVTGEKLIREEQPEKVIELLRGGKWSFAKVETPEVPEKLQSTLRKAVVLKPENRYPNANQMYMDLMHHLILTAPAADFMSELGTFVRSILEEATTENTAERNGLDSAVQAEPQAAEDATGEISIDVRAGAGAKKAAADAEPATGAAEPAAAAADETAPADTRSEVETQARDTFAELIDISDSAVKQFEARATEAGKTPATATPESHPSRPQADKSKKAGATDAMPETAVHVPGGAPSIKDAPAGKKEAADEQAGAEKKREKKSPPAAETAEKSRKKAPGTSTSLELVQQAPATRPETSPEFYSIIDEDEDEEELKTIIDVVRLSARSHKKGIITTAVALALLFLAFTTIDTLMQFTAYGSSLYDYISPPAIKIASIPSGAQVYLDDTPLQQTTPLRIEEIDPGVHKLMLVLPRFEPITKSITVPGKGMLNVSGEDARSPRDPFVFRFKTRLELSSNPPGAEVYINDVKLAHETPTTVHWDVAEAPMKIKMVRPGFPILEGLEINAIDGKETINDRRFWKFQRLDRTKDHFAIEGVFRKIIEVKSVPARAEIYLDEDERPIGITGINGTLLLTVGQHMITLHKNGYLPRKFTLDVNEGTKPTILHTLSRKVRIFAKNAASSDDSDIGATLVELRTRRRASKLKSTTPADVTLLPYRYTAVLRKKGYRDTYVQIPPSARTVVARMELQTAQISIFIIDAESKDPLTEAQVLFKGREATGPENQLGVSDVAGLVTGELIPGTYKFSVSKPGYEVLSKNLRIRGDQRNRLTFKLTASK